MNDKMNHFVMDDGKSVVERWDDFGFLQSIPEDKKSMFANQFDELARLLLDFDISLWVFPVSHKLMRDYNVEKIDFIKLMSAMAQAYYDVATGTKVYPEGVDVEAEMCCDCVSLYVGETR